MPRLSALIARLEDWLAPKCGNGFHRLERIGKQQYERLKRRGQIWYATHKKGLGRYIVLGLLAGYFYGMFLNSGSFSRCLTLPSIIPWTSAAGPTSRKPRISCSVRKPEEPWVASGRMSKPRGSRINL